VFLEIHFISFNIRSLQHLPHLLQIFS
jgi:hypothetical protein